MTDFQLTTEEQKLTNKLLGKIKQQIEISDGSISFAKYMQMALYDIECGYYTNTRHKIGEYGDFITSVEVSGLFGLCISRQIKELWQHGVAKNVLEFGAGNGKLMLDLLHELGDTINKYYVLELSTSLKALQQEMIAKNCPQYLNKVIWLDDTPTSFEGFIIANELLDAMPCELVRFTDNDIYQVHISLNQETGDLAYYNEVAPGELLHIAQKLPIATKPYLSEISLTNRGFMRLLGDILKRGAVLLIDYGHGMNEYYHPQKSNGTLRGFFRHNQLDNVLQLPGLLDITSNVDFSAIYNEANNVGLELIGYTTQANFLVNCGLITLLDEVKPSISDNKYLNLSSQVNHLISPNIMGEIFKAIGFSVGIDFADWRGFCNGDRSYLL